LTRIALGLEYDGAHFDGWQTQPHGRTVQDALEAALSRFAAQNIATICAGRTDAGVHASAQVVHFDTSAERDPHAWVRGVNALLPLTAAVTWAREVPADFDARRSARSRRYDYWIHNGATRSPLLAGRAAWFFRPLDAALMHEAAQALAGQHDFSSFRSAECQAATPVRVMRSIDVARSGPLLRIRLFANAYLHHMVRNIAGALLEVGAGRKPAPWVGELLAARDRTKGAPTAPAAGLYLTGVEYDERFGLEPVREWADLTSWSGPGSRSAD